MTSALMAKEIANALDNKKGIDITVLKIRDLTVIADYFVIASGNSSTQVKSLADEVEFQLKEKGIEPLRTEGYDAKSWILLDYGNVIVHVFHPEAREYYNLERLWADGEKVDISALA